jgi:membrane-bound ClpP family serine protease
VYWIKIHFAFIEEPWHRIVFGIGVDHLSQGNMPYDFTKKDPHNDFVKVLVEFGVAGLLLFLGFFRKIYQISSKNFNVLILIGIPMFFGNAIVNFPFNLAFILLITYEYKRNTAILD